MRLEPRIYYEVVTAAPVLEVAETPGAVNVMGGIGAGKGDPQEIFQACRGKFRVVTQNYKRKRTARPGCCKEFFKLSQV